MSAVRPFGATPPVRPGMPPRVFWPLCAWIIRAIIRGARSYGFSLPSPGPQEECPWRLSDVIPARMVSHTLRTWTCSHLTWRGQSSRLPAVSPSRVRPTAVSAIGTMRRAASTPFSSPEERWGRDRRWDHPAVRPWRRGPVRRPHGTRAHQPERRWGPPDRYRALSGLASFRGSCTRWRRIMISSRKPGRSCSLEAIDRPRCISTSKGPTVGRAKGRGRGQQPSRKLEGEKHG